MLDNSFTEVKDEFSKLRDALSPEERELQTRRQSLLLSRSQILSRLKLARNARYRAQLEAALAHVDSQLSNFE